MSDIFGFVSGFLAFCLPLDVRGNGWGKWRVVLGVESQARDTASIFFFVSFASCTCWMSRSILLASFPIEMTNTASNGHSRPLIILLSHDGSFAICLPYALSIRNNCQQCNFQRGCARAILNSLTGSLGTALHFIPLPWIKSSHVCSTSTLFHPRDTKPLRSPS